MKSLLTLCLLTLGLLPGFGQDVSQSQMAMSEGINNAFTITIEEPYKYVRDVWSKYMEKFGRVKKNKQKEYVSLGASVPTLASRPVDIFAKFEKMDKHTTLAHFWIRTDEGFFTPEQEDAAQRATDFVSEFKKEIARERIREELKKAEKELKKTESHLNRLIKDNERLHTSIKNYEKKIQRAKENIEKNEKDQTRTKEKLEKQKADLDEIKKRLEDI